MSTEVKLERKDCRILPGSKHIDQGLTHEQPDGDPNGDSYHCSADIYTVPIGGDTSRLRQAGLYN